MPRIVVIGSCNVDLTTFTDRIPKAGETMFGNRFDLGFGGKGANQAVAASILGAETHMVARVGNDVFGAATLKNFKELGVKSRYVKKLDKVASGVAPIFVESNGQNRIVVVSGANERVNKRAIDEAKPLLARADVIVLQFEIPLESVYYAVRMAKRLDVPVIVNPAPARAAELKKLASADYFIPNETETEALTGLPVRNMSQAKRAAKKLLEHGFRRVILTLGERGCLLASADELTHISAYPVDPVDSTGAGDAFIGSFAVFTARGIEEREAAARANLYAGLSTTRIGTQKSFPTESKFRAEWRKRRPTS